MNYKFKVWVWLPLSTEIHISANDDQEANKIFNQLKLEDFNWKDDGLRKSRATYEIVENVQRSSPTRKSE